MLQKTGLWDVTTLVLIHHGVNLPKVGLGYGNLRALHWFMFGQALYQALVWLGCSFPVFWKDSWSGRSKTTSLATVVHFQQSYEVLCLLNFLALNLGHICPYLLLTPRFMPTSSLIRLLREHPQQWETRGQTNMFAGFGLELLLGRACTAQKQVFWTTQLDATELLNQVPIADFM